MNSWKFILFILLDCILVYNAYILGHWWEIKRLVIVIFNLILSILSRGRARVKCGVFDVTILFDSFTHIQLLFCLCYIYIMPWYSFFYVLKALLDERCKLKVFGGNWQIWRSVDVLCRAWVLEVEWSDSSGIKKLTSIPF